MTITVEEALQLPAMKDAVLVAGHTGLKRTIASVNIMEVPDIARFIKKDELLLTTTFPIKDDVEAQKQLIPLLVEKDVAALAIKPVFYDNIVPQVMINSANQSGFPLIQLPRTTSFNEVINPILGEILNRQATVLKRNEAVHKGFTNLVLQGGTLQDIAQMLASLQDTPVSIHSSHFHLLAKAIPNNYEEYSEIVRNLEFLSKKLKRILGRRVGRVTAEIEGSKVDVHIQPVIVAGEDYARLIIWLTEGSLYETNVIEQAATIIALEIVKMRAVSETERRFRGHFIEQLIQGRIPNKADVLSRGLAFGWNLSEPYTPVVIGVRDYAKRLAIGQGNNDPLEGLRRLWTAVLQIADDEDIIAVHIGAQILLLFRTEPGIDIEIRIRRLINEIHKDLATEKDAIYAGIGRELADIMNLGVGVEQAMKALEIGRLISDNDCITHYDELGIFRVLSPCANHPESDMFCQELLGVLLESDVTNKTEYILTLDTFLRCNCNLREAASQLYIHYNTLRYRLSKIEELAAVDLDSSEDRLSLQIALKILRLRE